MTKATAPQRAITAIAAPTPMPADAPALNPLLGLLLGLLELLFGKDVPLGDDVGVGDERAAEEVEDDVAAEELVVVVAATTTAWPKFHPLIWIPTTDPPPEPTVVEVVNHGPVSVVIVRYFNT